MLIQILVLFGVFKYLVISIIILNVIVTRLLHAFKCYANVTLMPLKCNKIKI